MTVADMILYIKEHGFEDMDDTGMLVAINSAYHETCRKYPWEFLVVELSANTVAGNAAVVTTSEPRAMLALSNKTLGRGIRPIRRDQLRKDYVGSQTTVTSAPSFYYLRSSPETSDMTRRLFLFPIPDAVYALEGLYLLRELDLTLVSITGDVKIPSNYHEVVCLGALYRLYGVYDDTDNQAHYKQLYESMIQDMVDDDMVYQYDEPTIIEDFWGDENF